MAREGLLLRTSAEILADVQFPAVGAPVVVAFVAFPPCVHPVAADRPSPAEVELRAEVRHEGGIVEHVRFQRHVERLACRRFRLDGNLGGSGSGFRFYDRFGFRGRFGLRRRFRLRSGGGALDLADQAHGGTAQLGKEMLLHIPPRTAAAKHTQLPVAAVHDFTVPNDPYGSVAQNIERFVPIGHVRSCDKPLQSGPVDTQSLNVEGGSFERNMLFKPSDEVLRTLFRQTLVQLGDTFRRGRTHDPEGFHTARGVPLQGPEALRESGQTLCVVPKIGLQNRIPLTEIDLNVQGIGLHLHPFLPVTDTAAPEQQQKQ